MTSPLDKNWVFGVAAESKTLNPVPNWNSSLNELKNKINTEDIFIKEIILNCLF